MKYFWLLAAALILSLWLWEPGTIDFTWHEGVTDTVRVDTSQVPSSPMVGLFEGERRSHVEGGAVFFIIVIGGLLTVLWLYQAQR